jgi:hypothetical protein
MRENIRRCWWLLIVLAAAIPNPALATGSDTKADVTIVNTDPDNLDFWLASGSLGSARNEVLTESKKVKSIGCAVANSEDGGLVTTCTAWTPNPPRTTIHCDTDDYTFATIAASISGDSKITFGTQIIRHANPGLPDTLTPVCTTLSVDNDSAYVPKKAP